ncbi:hypothetical protein [Pedobacter sp. MC2016-24]|uniref:hypothetical protein n=1 Tax=Pedobacter sp. MC2016-24 TaxID=2780090 RepID=UPI001882E666|nr:hypothetical protein [Pedobacter sp. MC2016-24]MBE9602633.1 hypothetical protein [Pedobacter sp. MC2016-24]
MMETFTSVNNQNYLQSKQEKAPAEDLESLNALHVQMSAQLDVLIKDPSNESLQKILNYSKAGNFK